MQLGLLSLVERSANIDIKEESSESYWFNNHAPKFDALLKALEEDIENFVEDSRAVRRATKKLEFGPQQCKPCC